MSTFLNSFIRKKNFFLYISLITIISSFIICIFNVYYNIVDSISIKNENIINRELVISTTDDYEIVSHNLSKINSIHGIYKFTFPVGAQLKINDIDSVYDFQIVSEPSNIFPEIKTGKSIKEDDRNVIMLPYAFIQELSSENNIEILNKKVIFKVNINDEIIEYEGEVIGAFDSLYSSGDLIAYLPYSDMEEILYSKIKNDNDLLSYNIIVDKQKNVEKTIATIKELGYDATLYNESMQREINIFTIIQNVVTLMIFGLLFFIYIILYTIINNIFEEEKNDIAILKSIGYKNRDVFIVSLMKTLFLVIGSFVISILLSLALNKLIIYIIKQYLTDIDFTINILNINILAPFITILFISVISNIVSIKKIKKISPVLMFNSQ